MAEKIHINHEADNHQSTDFDRFTNALKHYVAREVVFGEPDPSYSRSEDEKHVTDTLLDTIVGASKPNADYKPVIVESHETRRMAQDNRVQKALAKITKNALLTSTRGAETDHPVGVLSYKDRLRARAAVGKVLDVFGMDPGLHKEPDKKIGKRPDFVYHARAEQMSQEIANKPEAEHARALAEAYFTIDTPIRQLLHKVQRSKERKKREPTEPDSDKSLRRYIDIQTRRSAAIYTHDLATYFEDARDPQVVAQKADTLIGEVRQLTKERGYTWDSDKSRRIKNRLNSVLLEVVSTHALQDAAPRYGWTEVRRATAEEDFNEGTDIYIDIGERVYRIDIKSPSSYRSTKGVSDNENSGVKVRGYGTKKPVIIVNAPSVGRAITDNNLVTGLGRGTELADSVHRAIIALKGA